MPLGIAAGDRDDLLIRVGEFRQRLADDLRISRRRRRRGFAALDFVFAESVKLIRLGDRRLVAFAFFGQDVEQDRLVLRLQKFEGAGEQRNIVPIDRSVIAQAELFENDARHEQALSRLLRLCARNAARDLPAIVSMNWPAFSCRCA